MIGGDNGVILLVVKLGMIKFVDMDIRNRKCGPFTSSVLLSCTEGKQKAESHSSKTPFTVGPGCDKILSIQSLEVGRQSEAETILLRDLVSTDKLYQKGI
jgi:hypothetical protein